MALGNSVGSVGSVGSGLFLSAIELGFTHPDEPAGAEPMRVNVEPPRKFAELLRREHERWERLGDGDAQLQQEPAECYEG